jgi:hypothetical protein
MERERKVLAHGAYGDFDERLCIAKSTEDSLIEDVDVRAGARDPGGRDRADGRLTMGRAPLDRAPRSG